MKKRKTRRRIRRATPEETKYTPIRTPQSPASQTHPTASLQRTPTNPQTLLTLQQNIGNRAVRALLQGKQGTAPGHGGLTPLILRQEEETGTDSAEAVEIDASQLGVEQELPGHGSNGSGSGSSGSAGGAAAGGSGGVTADVSLTVNPPGEESKPEADIAAAHGKPGVAGWTTPAYDIRVPSITSSSIDVDVTLDFKVELASEYTGATLDVLRDHEYGHVQIGQDEAQEHLVDGLDASLSAFSAFTSAPVVQATLSNAAANFVTAEGAESQSYDDADYPRMQQAYLGARTPLADLEAMSPRIATMAGALRDFNASIAGTDEENVPALVQTVITARGALDEDDLARLQYNPEFKALVNETEAQIAAFIESYRWDLWIIEFSTLDDEARDKLEELRDVLGDFEWVAPV